MEPRRSWEVVGVEYVSSHLEPEQVFDNNGSLIIHTKSLLIDQSGFFGFIFVYFLKLVIKTHNIYIFSNFKQAVTKQYIYQLFKICGIIGFINFPILSPAVDAVNFYKTVSVLCKS